MLILALALALQDAVFRAGFAEVDITPPLGTPRQGWNSKLVGDSVLDPIYARAAAFELGRERAVILVLDTALILAAETAEIRKRAAADHGLPADRLMVAATHNHAGPALINEALPRDEKYVATLVAKSAEAAGKALAALREAQVASGRAFEWEVAFNRRIVMRDGTVRTHGSFKDPNALCFEGPIDPEVGVLAVRAKDGTLLGALVNFACHPTHLGGGTAFSAGFPGAVARTLKDKGVPVTLYLQGACGNISHGNPHGQPEKTMDEVGRRLGEGAWGALAKSKWTVPARVSARTKILPLAFREPTPADLDGTARGTQRFGEKGYYERKIPELLEMMKKKRREEGEVQVFRVGDCAFAAQPSESFAELGLRIKEGGWPTQVFVVAYANGMLGYLPHEEAFKRGGYECTFGPPSLMAPDTGRRLADAAVELIRESK